MSQAAVIRARGVSIAAVAAKTHPDVVPDKQCRAFVRRVQREQQRLDGVDDALVGQRQARARCSTKRACARLDAELQAMERRKARHAQRLERFDAARAAACARGG
jgi:hypothetical protein